MNTAILTSARKLPSADWIAIGIGMVGIVLGPFIGAVAAEISAGQDARQAGRSGYGAWLGLLLGTAAKLAIAFLMIGIFIFQLGFGHMGVTA